MAGRVAAAAILSPLKVESILPLPIRNTFTDMCIVLAGMDGVTSPTGAAATFPADVHIMQIKLSVSELSHAHAVLGRDQLFSVATEAQLVVVWIEGGVKQFRIRLLQEAEKARPVRVMASRAIRLSYGAMMVWVFLQQRRHVLCLPAVFQGDLAVMAGQARVEGRLLQELGQH